MKRTDQAIFRPDAWPAILERFRMIAVDPRYSHMLAIADDILACGADGVLAARFNMWDLEITRLPVAAPPYDVVRVLAPTTWGVSESPARGVVGFEHRYGNERLGAAEGAVDQSVALFWAFLDDRLGIRRPS